MISDIIVSFNKFLVAINDRVKHCTSLHINLIALTGELPQLTCKLKMSSVIELLSDVSLDYEKLYESGKYTDISINVGQEPNNKIFFAHSLVLCTRSAYFEDKLTGNTEAPNTDEIQQTAMVFEDITPDIFEILLR